MPIVDSFFPKNRGEVLRETSRPIVGVFCAYVPEEVIHAAGLHPVHIAGARASAGIAQAHLPSNLCPYVRSCLEWAASEEARALSGVVFTNSCNAMQRLHDVWGHVGAPVVHFLDVPRVRTAQSLEFFACGIRAFHLAAAAHFARQATDAALCDSIRLYDQTRAMLSSLAELRQARKVRLRESEHVRLLEIARYWDREDFNGRLSQMMDALVARGVAEQETGKSVVITGSMSANSALIELVESAGARVAYSDFCTTSRYYEKKHDHAGTSPEKDLAARYLNQIPCARMKDAEARIRHLLNVIDERCADGVIYTVPQFCDTFLFEYPMLRRQLEKRHVKDLLIESDYAANNTGQLRTKIEAFIELLNA